MMNSAWKSYFALEKKLHAIFSPHSCVMLFFLLKLLCIATTHFVKLQDIVPILEYTVHFMSDVYCSRIISLFTEISIINVEIRPNDCMQN